MTDGTQDARFLPTSNTKVELPRRTAVRAGSPENLENLENLGADGTFTRFSENKAKNSRIILPRVAAMPMTPPPSRLAE